MPRPRLRRSSRSWPRPSNGRGRPDDALGALGEAARLDGRDPELRATLARALIARGDLDAASEYLTEEAAGDDLELRLLLAEMRLRNGQVDAGLTLLRTLVEEDAARHDRVALIGWKVAEVSPAIGFQAVETAVGHAVAADDWASAAAALQEFVTRVPNHVAALQHLVEICVDGGLEATMYSAQAQLADAYIASGSAEEARFIAEDLVAREPWERSNIERFRRALELAGEADPDQVIADRLSGQSPFATTDVSLAESELPAFDEASAGPAPEATASPALVADASEHVEVDLSLDLSDIGGAPPEPPPAPDVETALDLLRDESARKSALDAAEAEYQRGLALRDDGRLDESLAALETAAETPALRFRAASAAARIYRDQGRLPQVVACFERAAQAPPPSPAEGHQLLYELAEALESSGEMARALVVYMELVADAGDYRDARTRVDRLSKVQARG